MQMEAGMMKPVSGNSSEVIHMLDHDDEGGGKRL